LLEVDANVGVERGGTFEPVFEAQVFGSAGIAVWYAVVRGHRTRSNRRGVFARGVVVPERCENLSARGIVVRSWHVLRAVNLPLIAVGGFMLVSSFRAGSAEAALTSFSFIYCAVGSILAAAVMDRGGRPALNN